MFRQLPKSLPPDATAPADLQELGYFVTEKDQVRSIRDPSQPYKFRINRSDRVNFVFKEALNTCMRTVILERLLEKGMETLNVPIGAGPEDKHTTILVSKDLSTKDHVIVFFGDRKHEPGVLSYRVIGEETVNSGSLVDFVDVVLHEPPESYGLIIANPSQLLWCRSEDRAVTDREWLALPRPSAVHEAMRIDEDKNRIPNNRNHVEHVTYLFENVMRGICSQKAKFSIIGLEYTGSAAMQYLTEHWKDWHDQITAIALIDPQHSFEDLISGEPKPASVIDFIQRRTRVYLLSEKPPNMMVQGRERFSCNCYSSGEKLYEENVFIRCWPYVLSFFNEVRKNPNYCEPSLELATWHDGDEGEQ